MINFNGISQIGLVGGGSATLMLALEAAKKGIRTLLLDPKIDCIGSQVVSEHMLGALTNENIEKLSLRSDVVVIMTDLPDVLDAKLHSRIYPDRETINTLSRKKALFELLEELKIPQAPMFYYDNKEQVLKQMENLVFPTRIIQQYNNIEESAYLCNEEDATDFILNLDNVQNIWVQPMGEYTNIITCLCIVDQNAKITLYDVLEEKFQNDTLYQVNFATSFSKTLLQKVTRYSKKILKEIAGAGVYTIKYGIKANKGVELITISPEISLSGILTLKAYNISIYEQYLHMILNMKVIAPTFIQEMSAQIKQSLKEYDDTKMYHIYHVGEATFALLT